MPLKYKLAMLDIIKKLLGNKATRDLKELRPIVEEVRNAYEVIKNLSNDELRAKTFEFKEKIADSISEENQKIAEINDRIDNNPDMEIQEKEELYNTIDKLEEISYEKTQETLNSFLPEAFAVMKDTARRFAENEEVIVTATDMDRELASKRSHVEIKGDQAIYKSTWMAGGNLIKWDMIHYDVQLIGGKVLHDGKIAEMATGEGKTLVATIPVYLNALSGKGVHVVTVNDYLANRDCDWMGALYEFQGLSVDCIDRHEPNSEERRQAYLSDITFGTNNEFGFDYLRDNMTSDPSELVQRKHNYAIVDEVDSVLIDDARTPLIISGPTPRGEHHEFDELKPVIERLYEAQKKLINTTLVEAKKLLQKENPSKEERKQGEEQLLRSYRGLPKNTALIKFLNTEGIKTLLQRVEGHFMQEQSKHMHIIDDELYFVIDEKNNTVEITEKGIEMMTSNRQDPDFYILPDIGSQIAEIEKEDIEDTQKTEKKADLMRDYSVKSERIHSVNQLLKAYALFENDVEYIVMDNKVKIVDEQTGRIMEGRRYSDGLHQAIEAKESVKVEAATQTYATITLQNYFRMYRKLSGMTGTAETEAKELWDIYKLDVVVIPTNRPIVRDDQNDLVYKTTRAKFNAVVQEIQQLQEKGRPVLVGTTSVETSEILSRMLKRLNIKHNVLNAKYHSKEADIVAEAGQPGTVTIATNMAGRGTDIKLGEGVKDAGGLAIIGTERHESRRVDRQLRGRAGRQGDPGSSVFFVSLDDDLMRRFSSGRVSKVMDRLGLKEDEVIQAGMITKSIENAQKKVEENNFGVRKRLLEFDDVMNSQRDVIYKKRRHALYGDRLIVDINNMMYDLCENIIDSNQQFGDYESCKLDTLTSLACELPFTEDDFNKKDINTLTQNLFDQVYSNYEAKNKRLAERAYPVVKDIFENQHQYENIAIPITDGAKVMQVVINLKKAYESQGKEIALGVEKMISLSFIDNAWKEHLRELDDLKQAVHNASYEQKDPLLIYKLESFNLFKDMLTKINKEVISFLIKANLPDHDAEQVKETREEEAKGIDNRKVQEQREDLLTQAHSNTQTPQKSKPIVRQEQKIGRNDKVKVQYSDGRILEKKYKQVEADIAHGECQIVK
ncbi:MAG: preprotein translocase subunit SecA [Hyphomicrobiales bacterium]